MHKYVHPHVRELADGKKVSACLDRITKALESFHNNERAWQCLTSEDTSELRSIEERIKAIKAKYTT